MRFQMDDYFGPVAHDPEPGQAVLAAWVCRDVNLSFRVLLDALAMVDQVGNGEKPFEAWDSEGFAAGFDPSGVAIRALHGERRSASYGVDEVRSALESYWAFRTALPERDGPRPFRPDLPEWQAGLIQWEELWNLRHPYRGRLGIPAEGPA